MCWKLQMKFLILRVLETFSGAEARSPICGGSVRSKDARTQKYTHSLFPEPDGSIPPSANTGGIRIAVGPTSLAAAVSSKRVASTRACRGSGRKNRNPTRCSGPSRSTLAGVTGVTRNGGARTGLLASWRSSPYGCWPVPARPGPRR